MRTFVLTESRPKVLPLAEAQAAGLSSIGRSLKGRQRSWGVTTEDDENRSVISCIPSLANQWRVEVTNCIGVVRVGDTQIEVRPKIPLDHLVFLMHASGAVPRSTADAPATVASSSELWSLVVEWFVGSAEALLRRGLLRDYRPAIEELESLRGSLLPLETAEMFYRGNLGARCEFDEFDENSPLNRVIAGAARAVRANPLIDSDLRRRASRVYAGFDHVSDVRPADLLVQVDRRSHYYREPLIFAKHVLAAMGRLPQSGDQMAWSFLIPTPPMVEQGLRTLLDQHLSHRSVRKEGLTLGGSSMTVNPDLVLDGGSVVGDIKYKTDIEEWSRADLYQTVAFATAYRAAAGIVVAFGDEGSAELSIPIFGEVPVRLFRWVTSDVMTPEAASLLLAATIDEWLQEVTPTLHGSPR